MVNYNYESCREKLKKLIELNDQQSGDLNRNEATTRLQVIDELLFSCLSWDKSDCTSEEPHGSEYADYTIYAGRRSMIIEAKKEGTYFQLPAGTNRRSYSISTIFKDNAEIKAAIFQAMGYCQKRGVQIGVVCNGQQIIAFIATRTDGVPPENGKAIVFESLKSMYEDFLALWNYLSKPGLQENNLLKELIGESQSILPPKLSTLLLNYPGMKNRNMLQTDLQILSDLVLEEAAKLPEIEEAFINECYCPSGALSQYALVSKEILQNKYTGLFRNIEGVPAITATTNKKGLTDEFTTEIFTKRPIILLGDVGVGKTMFLKHFIFVEAKDIFKNAITIYVDLGSKAALAQDLRKFVIEDIKQQFRKEYHIEFEERNFVRGVYNIELHRFAQGIHSELKDIDPNAFKLKEIDFLEKKLLSPEVHIKNCIEHISKGWKKQVIFVLDNADQRDEEVQQNAFLIANEVAAHWAASVFLTLRPETFYKSKKEGTLSGYHPKAFTIAPPRVDEVIDKRLSFARKIATGELVFPSLSHDISVKLEKLVTYLEIMISSFRTNDDLIEFIDNITNGNIRKALELIHIFIGSGHVDTQKILDRDAENLKKPYPQRYRVSLHEFLRAILFGDGEYYDPRSSELFNVFDISSNDQREYFLLSIILSYLADQSTVGDSQGYVELTKVYESVQDNGFTVGQIDNAVIRLLKHNLIDSETRVVPLNTSEFPKSLRITNVGLYHIRKLVTFFSYIDAIIVDTPILDEGNRTQIKDSSSLLDRLQRAEIFISYLESQWKSLNSSKTNFKWQTIASSLKAEIAFIRSKVNSLNHHYDAT